MGDHRKIDFKTLHYAGQEGKLIPLLVGMGLMVYPYFISDPLSVVLIGAALMVVPYFYRD